MRNKLHWLLLPLLFSIAVLLKMNILQGNTQSGYTNYFNFLDAWHHQSPSQCYFSPTNTYENQGDKFVKYWPGLTDTQGNCYYNSFPPFSFQLGYFLWWLTGFASLPKLFLYLNFIFHGLIALLVFKIVQLILHREYNSFQIAAPLLSFVLALFTPTAFWFFSSYFFIENFALLLLAASTYCMLLYHFDSSRKNFLLVLLSIAALCYTEVIGYFAALCFLLYLINSLSTIRHKKIFQVMAIPFFVLAFTIFQYALLEGSVISVLHNFAVRMMGRSGYFKADVTENHLNIFSIELYQRMWYLLKTGMLPLLLLSVAVIISAIFRKKEGEIKNEIFKHNFWIFILLPTLLHLLIFINANALHDQLIVKLVFPLSIICGCFIGIFSIQKLSRWLVYGCIATAIGVFYYPIVFAIDIDDTNVNSFAQKIKSECKPNQTIIIIGDRNQYYLCPSLFYHSKRNCYLLNDTAMIKDVTQPLERTIADSSVIYKVDANWNVLEKSMIRNN